MLIEYFIFIFFSSLVVIQAASAWQNLEFVLFLRSKPLTYILSVIVIIASYYWFFYLGGKHIRNTGGNQQLIIFPFAILSSTIFTLFFTSLINAGSRRKGELKEKIPIATEGIEVLKEMTYWQAVCQYLFPQKK